MAATFVLTRFAAPLRGGLSSEADVLTVVSCPLSVVCCQSLSNRLRSKRASAACNAAHHTPLAGYFQAAFDGHHARA